MTNFENLKEIMSEEFLASILDAAEFCGRDRTGLLKCDDYENCRLCLSAWLYEEHREGNK